MKEKENQYARIIQRKYKKYKKKQKQIKNERLNIIIELLKVKKKK
jgi:hypothetical protein